ncbi:MAG: hypothetical protein O2954_03830 [bacterium]|nr:hypothetical protein [bacterium]
MRVRLLSGKRCARTGRWAASYTSTFRRIKQEAYNFFRQALDGLPFVVLSTSKPDKYNRYLAELFYLPGENNSEIVREHGIFLNRVLLEEGLAKRFDA